MSDLVLPADFDDRLAEILDPGVGAVHPTGMGTVPLARSDFDLNQRPMHASDRPPLVPAAVLAGIVRRGGVWRVLLTKRADTLRRHAGQIAFPGGRVDPGDASLAATALREAHEEVGLSPQQVRIIGAWDGYETITGFAVTPFVGVLDADFAPTLHPGEVADVFEADLAHVLHPDNIAVRQVKRAGQTRRYFEIRWDDRVIWGATAGMLKALSDRVRARVPD